MQNNVNYSEIMSSKVYKRLNPIQNHSTSAKYSYKSESHTIGVPIPLHFFGIAKVWVIHQYNPGNFGFVEPVAMRLKLKNGKWYATNVQIEP
jgi:hypothetical protein